MLTTRAVGVDWLGAITLILACCAVIATFVDSVGSTLCEGFDVTFICCPNIEAVVTDVTFTFVATIENSMNIG